MTYNNELRKGVTLRLMLDDFMYNVVEDDGKKMKTVASFGNVIEALHFYDEYFKTECDTTKV